MVNPSNPLGEVLASLALSHQIVASS